VIPVLVLGNAHSRQFNAVFEEAQKVLRNTFGMEMVELRTRAALVSEPVAAGEAVDKQLADAAKGTNVRQKSEWLPYTLLLYPVKLIMMLLSCGRGERGQQDLYSSFHP
jgi:hypothetical protein